MNGPISKCCCTGGKAGYKFVIAEVAWFGRYGFDQRDADGFICADTDVNWWDADPCPGSACSSYIPYSPKPRNYKYLSENVVIEWHQTTERIATYPPACTGDTNVHEFFEFTFNREFGSAKDRFTALETNIDTAEVVTRTLVGEDLVEETLTDAAATAWFLTQNPPWGGTPGDGYYQVVDALCGHISQTDPHPTSGYTTVSISVEDNLIEIVAEINENLVTNPECTGLPGTFGTDTTTIIGTFKYTFTLDDKFTSQQCYAYAKELLGLWQLDNDTEYPWRTTCSGEAYHFGALVTFNYAGFYEYPPGTAGVPGQILGGPYTGETWNTGTHQWTGYTQEGISGAQLTFYTAAAITDYYVFPASTLVMAKWVEAKVELPAHNWARPCGTDAEALDEDLVTPCWTGLPNPCSGACNDTTPTGDYTTLEATYNQRALEEAVRLNGMAALCGGPPDDGPPCTTPVSYTVPPAWERVCTQENATVGTVLYCSPTQDFGPGVGDYFPFPAGMEENCCDGKYVTNWWFHIRQAMPDPLGICPGLYPDDEPPLMEESRCEEPSGCPALPTGSELYCVDADTVTDACAYIEAYGMRCPPETP